MATPVWVPLKRALKFPEILRVYKRAGWGQGTGQGIIPTNPVSSQLVSAQRGFLRTVKIFLQGKVLTAPVTDAGASWLRKTPGGTLDIMDCQVDVANIPGVRQLRKDGKWAKAA